MGDQVAAQAFLICDHLLVFNSEYFCWQNLLPMVHEAAIFLIIFTENFQIGIIAMSFIKFIHEAGNAIFHRVAQAMDNFCVWKQQIDHAKQHEIMRHFIGDPFG